MKRLRTLLTFVIGLILVLPVSAWDGGGNLYLVPSYIFGNDQSANTFDMNSSLNMMELTFNIPPGATGKTINAIGFAYSTKNGTPPTYRVSLQTTKWEQSGATDGTSGQPSGTILTSGTFTPPNNSSWDNTWQWVTVSNYVPTGGNFYCAVIDYSAGTINGSNFSTFVSYVSVGVYEQFPHLRTSTNGGSGWSDTGGGTYPVAIRCSDGTVYGLPWVSSAARTLSNGQRNALKFVVPRGARWKVQGLRFFAMDSHNFGECTYAIWDINNNVVASRTSNGAIGSDDIGGANAQIYFTSIASLQGGATYYAGVEKTDGNGFDGKVKTFIVGNNGDLSALSGSSSAYYSLWNGSSWTDTTTERPMMGLIFDTVPNGTSASVGGGL